MLDVLIQRDLFGKLIHIVIDEHPDVTASFCLLQYLLMAPLFAAYHRSQKLNTASFRQLHDLIHHLVHGLLCDLFPALRTMGDTDPGIQKAEIIVNFCHGSHRGAGISVSGFLINGNSRRKSFYALHLRFFHLSKKLSCIGR